MNEQELIQLIINRFPRSNRQLNKPFTSDAELLHMGDDVWALTMDEFSADEDMFIHQDATVIGHNLAVATVSDILAAGALPCFYMHSVSFPADSDIHFMNDLMSGIEGVLTLMDCFLCGGDIGTADPWRYCGFCLGRVESTPLTHVCPPGRHDLWITGQIGDANAAAFTQTDVPKFELRTAEAELARNYASACIDTSSGLYQALFLLQQQSPQTALHVYPDDIPFAASALATCREHRVPRTAALLGAAGEYELLLAVPSAQRHRFSGEAQNGCFQRIGYAESSEQAGLYFHFSENTTKQISQAPPDPRTCISREDYIRALLALASELQET